MIVSYSYVVQLLKHLELLQSTSINLDSHINMPPAYTPHPEYDYARDFQGYGEEGLNPKWPNNAKIAVSFVINYEEVFSSFLNRFT